MWQALLAAAATVTAAKHFISKNTDDPDTVEKPDKPIDLRLQFPLNANGYVKNCEEGDGIFKFCSSGSKVKDGSSKKVRKVGVGGLKERGKDEQRKRGKKVSVCLKKRKTVKDSGLFSSTDRSLFGRGLGVGIMCMMSAGRAKMAKLNATVEETAKVVQELKTELSNRISLQNAQNSVSANGSDLKSVSVDIKLTQECLNQTRNGTQDSNCSRVSESPVSEDGEYASSVLTEEPEEGLEAIMIDQLEAELESELEKLPLSTESCHGEMNPNLCESKDPDLYETHQSHGVSPSELDKKLCHVLLEQQENQIAMLENELHSAHSKLLQKESELQALKDCVKRLTEFSLSSNSDEETEAQGCHEGSNEWNYSKMEPQSKKSVVGAKRPINNELCSYYV